MVGTPQLLQLVTLVVEAQVFVLGVQVPVQAPLQHAYWHELPTMLLLEHVCNVVPTQLLA